MAHRTTTPRPQTALRTLLVALAAASALTGCYEIVPPPSACTTEFAPVCGDDGVTYANACMADSASATVAHAGPCVTGNTCASDTDCNIGATCQFPRCAYPGVDAGPGYPTPPMPDPVPRCGDGAGTCEACVCPAYYSPVCGADGITYGNECEASCGHTTVVSSGECGAVCVPLACPPIWCEFGNAVDANGCTTCACNPPPTCADVPMCGMYCEFGYVTDPTTGCPLCECNPPPACTGTLCDVFCEFGNVLDAAGCPTCECNPPPTCAPLACDLYCSAGYARDAAGCEVCACNPPTPTDLCLSDSECAPGNYCDFSMPSCVDPVCPPGAACPPSRCYGSCVPTGPTCAPIACYLYCEFGFARDATGCEICACNEPPPPPPPVRLCLDSAGCNMGEYCDRSVCFTAPGASVCYGACFGGYAADGGVPADAGSSGGGGSGSADAGVPVPAPR